MQSTLNQRPTDPYADPHDDVLVARIDEELSKLAQDAMRDPLDPQTHMGSDISAGPAVPPVDTTFRAAAVNHVRVSGLRPSIGVRAVRGFIGFLLAVCIGVAGIVWQAYGDAAKQMIGRWAPQFVATSSPPPENAGLPEQPNPPAVEASAAKTAPPAPVAQAAAEGVAPAAAAPESAVLLESMARELASARQEIDQLKASQQQMSREIAKSSETKSSSAKSSQAKSSQTKAYEAKAYEAKAYEAKASQTRTPEQNLRPRISALPPRSVAAPARSPMPPSYPPPQAAAAPALPQAPGPYVPRQSEPPPQVTAQPQAEPEFSPPRPPMPVLR
jgi:hypothetical protein